MARRQPLQAAPPGSVAAAPRGVGRLWPQDPNGGAPAPRGAAAALQAAASPVGGPQIQAVRGLGCAGARQHGSAGGWSRGRSAVEANLGDPAVGDGCAAAVLALVRFNKDVFVEPVLMGPAVGALVASASSSLAPLCALNGLVAAIRSPLVDELHARGELPRLVALLYVPDPRVRALALEFALRVSYYGRKEVVDMLLAEGLVKRLRCALRYQTKSMI